MTIVSLRGTSGAGKSTVVYKILDKYPSEGLDLNKKGVPTNHKVTLPTGQHLYVIGRYTTQCGGVDTITDYTTVIPALVKRFAPKGHVLFEGMLLSNTIGPVGKLADKYGDDYIYAFLDTPIEVCIERVKARRLEKGNTKPFDPTNTQDKHRGMWGCKVRAEAAGYRTVVIDHTKAFSQVMKLFGVRARG